jgi:hypothetical protein
LEVERIILRVVREVVREEMMTNMMSLSLRARPSVVIRV